MPLLYILTFIGMMILESIYIPLARRFHIGMHTAARRSARNFTPAGGGIIFPVAAAVFAATNPATASQPFFSAILLGALILSCISFVDDVHSLPPVARLIIQFVVTGTIFSYFLRPDMLDIYLIMVVSCVGLINAFNFLDGINGMLTLYAAVVIVTMIVAINTGEPLHMPACGLLAGFSTVGCTRLLCLILTSHAAFALFNFRTKALVYSGDVGSIFTGFVITAVLASICIGLRSMAPVAFVAVFAVDSALTIIHRLFEGEQIMQPHRRHLYQYFAHNLGKPHTAVSMTYAAVQAFINVGYFIIPQQQRLVYTLIVYLILISLYFWLHSYKKHQKTDNHE